MILKLNECNHTAKIDNNKHNCCFRSDILTPICSKSPVSKDVGVCISQQLSPSSSEVTGGVCFQVTTRPLFVPAANIPRVAKNQK